MEMMNRQRLLVFVLAAFLLLIALAIVALQIDTIPTEPIEPLLSNMQPLDMAML